MVSMSKKERIRKQLTDAEATSAAEKDSGELDMDKIIAKLSLRDISLEERRREANKPLYLVRYE